MEHVFAQSGTRYRVRKHLPVELMIKPDIDTDKVRVWYAKYPLYHKVTGDVIGEYVAYTIWLRPAREMQEWYIANGQIEVETILADMATISC